MNNRKQNNKKIIAESGGRASRENSRSRNNVVVTSTTTTTTTTTHDHTRFATPVFRAPQLSTTTAVVPGSRSGNRRRRPTDNDHIRYGDTGYGQSVYCGLLYSCYGYYYYYLCYLYPGSFAVDQSARATAHAPAVTHARNSARRDKGLAATRRRQRPTKLLENPGL